MLESRAALIEATLAPFPDPSEERLHAQCWLEKTLTVGDDSALALPLKRLHGLPLKSSFQWITLILLVVSLVVAGLLVPPLWKTHRLVRLDDPSLDSDHFLADKSFTPQQRLLLGDPTKPSFPQKEALWQSDPGNPAYFSEYVLAYREKHHALPPGYWETVQRIDPENGWFDYLAAEVIGSGAVEKKVRGKGVAPDWGIRREKEYREALALISSGGKKPRVSSYSEELLRQQITLLPRDTHAKRLGSIVYLLGQASSNVMIWRACGDLLATRVREAGKTRDTTALRTALSDAEAMMSHTLANQQATFIELLGTRAALSGIARQAEFAATECGEHDAAKRIVAFKAAVKERNDRINASYSWARLIHAGRVESMLLSEVAKGAENPPLLTAKDLQPSRLRDQSFYSAFYSFGIGLLLVIALLGTFLYRFRGPGIFRRLSPRLGTLLQPSDWAWILSGGILLPLGLWLVAIFLTPIGGRGVTHPGHFFATPLLNAELLAGLLLVSPVLFVRWRLGIRANVLGLRKRSPWLWFGLFCLAALIAGISIIPDPAGSVCPCGHVDWAELFPWRAFTSLSLLPPVIWLAVVIGRALFSSSQSLPFRMTAARSLMSAYAFGMMCLLATAIGFLVSFKHWENRNPLLELSAEKPASTPYEYDVTRQLQTELRALWNN